MLFVFLLVSFFSFSVFFSLGTAAAICCGRRDNGRRRQGREQWAGKTQRPGAKATTGRWRHRGLIRQRHGLATRVTPSPPRLVWRRQRPSPATTGWSCPPATQSGHAGRFVAATVLSGDDSGLVWRRQAGRPGRPCSGKRVRSRCFAAAGNKGVARRRCPAAPVAASFGDAGRQRRRDLVRRRRGLARRRRCLITRVSLSPSWPRLATTVVLSGDDWALAALWSRPTAMWSGHAAPDASASSNGDRALVRCRATPRLRPAGWQRPSHRRAAHGPSWETAGQPSRQRGLLCLRLNVVAG